MRTLLLLSALVFAHAATSQTKEAARQKAWEWLKAYHPDAHHFMKKYYELPTKYSSGGSTITVSPATDFMVYVSKYDEAGLLSDLPTAVHEVCHGYQGMRTYSVMTERTMPLKFSGYNVYYISANEEYLVPYTPTFPSIDMAGEFPTDLRVFRYETYINTKNKIQSTQQHGIYGLMDEWAAYYNGTKVVIEAFPIYKKRAEQSVNAWFDFISNAASIHIAHAEFKYYILHYLDYASRKNKEVFDAIMANEEFRKTFRAIDKNYGEVNERYKSLLDEVKAHVEQKGMTYKHERNFIFIGNSGRGSYADERARFEKELSLPKYNLLIERLLE
jgi:hypothetical protein